ncbi:MAG: CpsD/CapB family tyrosine-protein kinase [Candidatus Eisenbacteria sp.]|nr:CpsD/CapB family tyrosine-protein kinase [Candidatus Eisenbacteria bacterium]
MRTTDRLNEDWVLASEIHKLEARLWGLVRRENIRVVMVTSAERGEGKSMTVAYLATALARHPERKILAVDLDFRQPQLRVHFGIDGPRSFAAVLNGQCRIEDVLVKTDLPSLDLVLPCPEGEDPNLLLKTTELGELFAFFRQRYDLVLMDVPALIPVADASALMSFADGIVLVVMAGRTTRPMLSRARDLCLGMDARILGLVVGNLKEAVPEYGDSSYYYGYRTGYAKGQGSGRGRATRDRPRHGATTGRTGGPSSTDGGSGARDADA